MNRLRRRALASAPSWAAVLALGSGRVGEPRLAEPSGAPLASALALAPDLAAVFAREAAPALATQSGLAPAAFTLADAAAGRPGEAPAPGEPSPVEPAPAPQVVWRFASASPFTGPPAVNDAGLVYGASGEGFVHALDAGGALRWSYGLEGIPVGSPAVDAAGQVYVATTAPRLHALRADGHLTWMQRTATRFATPPVWASPGLLYYFGRDQNLYSIPTWGGEPRRRYLGHASSGALASLGDGLVALGLDRAEAHLYRGSSFVARLVLDGILLQPLLGGRERWFATTRSGLAAFDVASRARAWAVPGRHAAVSADERSLLVVDDRELRWLSPETGAAGRRVHLPGEVSAPPAVTNAGLALVPMVAGDVLVVDGKTGRIARVRVASAPVWAPVWNEQNQRVTVAAGGSIVSFELGAPQPVRGGA